MTELAEIAQIIVQARTARDGGRREEALVLLKEALEVVVSEGNDVLSCYVAHDLGHLVENPNDQLVWHKAALGYADKVADDSVAVLYPSLHANLGATYLHLGDLELSRRHYSVAETTSGALSDDDYGHLVRSGIKEGLEKLDALAGG